MKIQRQAEALFNFYDRQRIGVIPKQTLLAYLTLIDNLITQEWLSKQLLIEGQTISNYIDCQEFIKIMRVISNVANQGD